MFKKIARWHPNRVTRWKKVLQDLSFTVVLLHIDYRHHITRNASGQKLFSQLYQSVEILSILCSQWTTEFGRVSISNAATDWFWNGETENEYVGFLGFSKKMQMPSHDKYFILMHFGPTFSGHFIVPPPFKRTQMNLLDVHEFLTKLRLSSHG